MKKSIFISILAISMTCGFIACNSSTTNSSALESKPTEKAVYTCTMHPEVRSDKPGECPKCGMALVKMNNSDSTQMHNESDTTHMMN